MENSLVKEDGIFDVEYELSPAWAEFLSAIARRERRVVGGLAESLVDDLFYLEEPWRGRFLDLVANLATSWAWCGQCPTRDEMVAWLCADLGLYQHVRDLLDAWWRPTDD
jgi:hypothetical protein